MEITNIQFDEKTKKLTATIRMVVPRPVKYFSMSYVISPNKVQKQLRKAGIRIAVKE